MESGFFWEHYPNLEKKKSTLVSRGDGNQRRINGHSQPIKMGDKWTIDYGGKDVETKIKGIMARRR